MTEENEERVQQTIGEMAETAKGWDHHEFASRTVGLLILDQGSLNAYQRTLELIFQVHRLAVLDGALIASEDVAFLRARLAEVEAERDERIRLHVQVVEDRAAECRAREAAEAKLAEVTAQNATMFQTGCEVTAELARLGDALAGADGLIRWAHDTLYEINMDNYDHNEVDKLNAASVEVILGLAPYLKEKHGKSDEWWAQRATRTAPEGKMTAPVFNRGDLVEKHGGRYGGPGRIVGETDELSDDGYRLYAVAMKVEGGYGEFVHVFPESVLRPRRCGGCGEAIRADPMTGTTCACAQKAATDCGLDRPSYHDCPNMQEVGGGFEGERYHCAVCGKGYFLDYEDMK